MELNSFKFPRKVRKAIKRVGRGRGSGHGKTCGRGGKGQSARTGYSQKRGFEGGQMPLQRRLPKRGFTNIFRKEFEGVNVSHLSVFEKGTRITIELLKERGMVKKSAERVKILGHGSLEIPLTVVAQAFSSAAREKIVAAGGSVEVAS